MTWKYKTVRRTDLGSTPKQNWGNVCFRVTPKHRKQKQK